jgi:hypothetical protein
MQQLWSVWALGEVLHQETKEKGKSKGKREIGKSEVKLGKKVRERRDKCNMRKKRARRKKERTLEEYCKW